MNPTQNTPVLAVQPSRCWDRAPETDFDRRFFDLRDAGYMGPIDQDGHPAVTFDPEAIPADNTATTLRCAARYLSRHGWTQGAFYAATGRGSDVLTPPACVGGALAIVCFGFPVEVPGHDCDLPGGDSYRTAIDYLDDYLLARYDLVAFTFNDVQGRTAIQVIAMLLRAADAWEHTNGGAA